MIWSSGASLIICLIFQVKKEILGILVLFRLKRKIKVKPTNFPWRSGHVFHPVLSKNTVGTEKKFKTPLLKTKGTLAASTRELDHRQSSMKGYKNQARRRKGITTTVKLKLKESIVHKTEKRRGYSSDPEEWHCSQTCAKRRVTNIIIQRTGTLS